eukprot:gene16588-19706_t
MSELKELKQDVMSREILAAGGDEKLLYELQPKAFNLLLEEFRLNASSTDPLKRLEEICKTYLNFGLDNPQTYQLMFTPIYDLAGQVRFHPEKDTAVFNYFTDCLERCLRRELVHFKNAEIGTLQIWSLIHGLISLNLTARIDVIGISEAHVPATLNKTVDDFLASITR